MVTCKDSKITANTSVYNLSVAVDESYVIPASIVHNCRCNVVQVGKNSRSPSNSAKAIARGRAATTQLDSKGRNKAKIFRFNPGKKQKVFPDKHPYFKVNDPDVERTVEAMSKENEIVIPTEKGSVVLSATQNKHEINDNTTIAVYLANKHGYDIELLDINNNKNVKNPDSLNRTLSLKQEYKTQKNATRNSIEQAIRNGAKQADSIVLNIEKTELTKELIKHIVQHRMRRYDNLKSVFVIIDGDDFILTNDKGPA